METAKGELVPGGLALIVPGVDEDPNVGKVVELISTVTGPSIVEVNGGVNLVYVPDGVRAWIVTGEMLAELAFSGLVVPSHELVVREHKLMPIKPIADPLHTEEKQCQSA